jgi:D-alanyl-D-alanine carboxypeptidase
MLAVKRDLLAVALIACLVLGCNSSNESSIATPRPTVAERLQSVLDQAVIDGVPGVALAVRGDNVDFSGVAGVEDIATAVPLTVNHRFYLASVGKTYTAVAMVRMAADGLLHLDDPITAWLPSSITDRIPSSAVITIRSLLNHTSGIFDYQDDADEWLFQAFLPNSTRHWSNADILPFFLDKPLHFEPTTDAKYADSNYVLIGLIAEAASGSLIQDVIRNYALAPLGLLDTAHGYEAQGLPNFVHGYVELDGELLDVYPWYSHYGVTDGGIQSSAADLAEFVDAIFTTDTILDDPMRAEMLMPSGVGNPPSDTGLGIDVAAGIAPDVTDYWNAGQDAGARSEFHHVTSPAGSVTIAIVASASLGEFENLFQQTKQSVEDVLIDAGILQGSLP